MTKESKKSSSELYFEWWLDELKESGLVLSWEREPETFVLANAEPVYYYQRKKKLEVQNSFNLFKPITYTPDYRVVFSKKLYNKFFGLIKNACLVGHGNRFVNFLQDDESIDVGSVYQNVSYYTTIYDSITPEYFTLYFDVKPPSAILAFASNVSSSREFPIKQRLMFEKHGIYVNKVVPYGSKNCLFTKTFLPKRYRYTDANKGPRKLKDYEQKAFSLEKYLESKKIIL